jgi:hypothetical protein
MGVNDCAATTPTLVRCLMRGRRSTVTTVQGVPTRPVIDDDDEATRRQLRWLPVEALAVVIYCLGWLAGAILVPLAAVCRWVFAALATGWDDAYMMWSWRRRERK